MRKSRFLAGAVMVMALGGLLMFGLSGCFGTRYKVDYDGRKDDYQGAKNSYRAGQQVVLYYDLIATDTDYSFYLDGEPLNVGYDHGKGFEIRFVMPEHDVKLECRSKNTMIYEPDPIMWVDYRTAVVGTDGYDQAHELVLNETYPNVYQIEVCDTDPDGTETRASYSAPEEAKARCFELIRQYRFDEWDKLDGIALDGAATVVRYRSDNGDYIRASTDNMPEDGEQKLDEVGKILSSYLAEENRID